MSNNKVVALSEAAIDKQMLEVIDCSNRVKAIFNKIDDLVEKLKLNYQCQSATTLYSKYNQFNDNYSVIIDNILSYNSDLISLKKKYATALDDLSQKIKMDTLKLESDGPKTYMEER